MMSKAIKSVFFLGLMVAGSACSAKNASLVSHAEFSTNSDAGGLVGDLSVFLNTNGLPFPTIEIPVANPKDRTEIFGQVTLTNLGTMTQLNVKVDLLKLAHIQGEVSSSLPNGGMLPVAGLQGATVMAFPIGNGNASRLYVGLKSGKLVLAGVAMVVSEFDRLGSIGLPLNIFYPFKINQLSGTAGIFTGTVKGQSGIAAFAGTAVNLPASGTPAPGNRMFAATSIRSLINDSAEVVATFPDLRPSNKQGKKVYDKTKQIAKEARVLHIDI